MPSRLEARGRMSLPLNPAPTEKIIFQITTGGENAFNYTEREKCVGYYTSRKVRVLRIRKVRVLQKCVYYESACITDQNQHHLGPLYRSK